MPAKIIAVQRYVNFKIFLYLRTNTTRSIYVSNYYDPYSETNHLKTILFRGEY